MDILCDIEVQDQHLELSSWPQELFTISDCESQSFCNENRINWLKSVLMFSIYLHQQYLVCVSPCNFKMTENLFWKSQLNKTWHFQEVCHENMYLTNTISYISELIINLVFCFTKNLLISSSLHSIAFVSLSFIGFVIFYLMTLTLLAPYFYFSWWSKRFSIGLISRG